MNTSDFSVHRAVVHSSNVTTGEALVRIPGLLGAGQTVKVPSLGLTKANNEYNVPSKGTSAFVVVSPDRTQFMWVTGPPTPTEATSSSSSGSTSKFATTVFGDGSSTSFTVNHQLGTLDVVVMVYDRTSVTRDVIHVDTRITDANNIEIEFDSPPSNSPQEEFRVVVIA